MEQHNVVWCGNQIYFEYLFDTLRVKENTTEKHRDIEKMFSKMKIIKKVVDK